MFRLVFPLRALLSLFLTAAGAEAATAHIFWTITPGTDITGFLRTFGAARV